VSDTPNERMAELERENAALREMVDLAFRIPHMTDAEIVELIRNCRAIVGKEKS
jgi:hypothetical protein